MKLMVACTTLTWVEVDTDTGEVGPARVFNLPENVEVEGQEPGILRGPTVLVVDPEFTEYVPGPERDRAIELVQQASTFEFVFEERATASHRSN